MKVMFISGPYRAKTEFDLEDNIRRAEKAAMHWWGKGWATICPHKNTAHFGGLYPDEYWLEGDLEFLRRSDAVCMVQGWSRSAGAQAELKLAEELGKEIIFMPDAEDE